MSENDSGKYTIDLKITNPPGACSHSQIHPLDPIALNNYTFIKPPESSEWQCYLFGNRPGGVGMIYRPKKGREPNWLVRWFMRVCFDCLWVKDKPKPEEQSKKL